MSSHWDWVDRVIAEHNEKRPFAPENGQPLKFKPGDKVVYTNPAGIQFNLTVTDYYTPCPIDSQYATGGRYTLDWDCYWFPVAESDLMPRDEQRDPDSQPGAIHFPLETEMDFSELKMPTQTLVRSQVVLNVLTERMYASVQKHGLLSPLAVEPDGTIINGVIRYKAIEKLRNLQRSRYLELFHLEKIPVIIHYDADI